MLLLCQIDIWLILLSGGASRGRVCHQRGYPVQFILYSRNAQFKSGWAKSVNHTGQEDTSHHWHFLQVIFTTHHCHLLQVSLKHITVTSSRQIYSTSLSPPAGIFSTHHCHLLQVPLQHITATFSCPRGCKKTTLYWWRVYYQWGYLVQFPPPAFLFIFLVLLLVLDPGHWTLDTGHWTLDTPPPPQDLDPWRLPVPAPRVQTAAYRETNITGEYLGLQIRLVLSYFYFSKNGPKNIQPYFVLIIRGESIYF